MRAGDVGAVGQVGNAARHLEDAVITARRQVKLVKARFRSCSPWRRQCNAVRFHPELSSALALPWRAICRSRAALTRARTTAVESPPLRAETSASVIDGDIENQIDAIQQRAGQFAAIARYLVRRAATARLAEMTAGARVHCGDQLEACGKAGAMAGAGDMDVAAFQRLAQGFEHATVELRQLVEKKHAVMRERDFAPGRGTEPPPTRAGAEAE